MSGMTDNDKTMRMLRTGFGRQVKSEQESQPAYGFGTSHRDASGKLYLSAEQAKAMSGNNSQGPVYKTYVANGPQTESQYATAPVPMFGTSARNPKYGNANPGPGAYSCEGGKALNTESKRQMSPRAVFGVATRDKQAKVWLDDEMMKQYCGAKTPGPCSYKTPGSLGKQFDSKYSTEPGWVCSTSERFASKNPATDGLPGAGAYAVNTNATGKQVMSQKKTLPSPKIGTGTRDAFKKVFITKEHEKNAYGMSTPGPMTSQIVDSFGVQKMSVKKSMPSWGFGTSKRGANYGSDSPGPGAYYA